MLPVGGAGKGVVRLPTKTKTWTVNKSPHVHGKAKESFRRFMHRVLIPIEAPNHVTLRWITAIRDAGVTAKVSFKLEVSGGGRATNEKDGKRGIDKDRVRYNDKYLRDRAAGNLEGMQVLARDRRAARMSPEKQRSGEPIKQLLRKLQAQAVYQQSLPEASAAQQARLERWQQELCEWQNQHAWESSYRYLQRRADWEQLLLQRLIAAEKQQLLDLEEERLQLAEEQRRSARRSSMSDDMLASDSDSSDGEGREPRPEDEWSDFFDSDSDQDESESESDSSDLEAAAAAAEVVGDAAVDSDDDADAAKSPHNSADSSSAAAAADDKQAAADSSSDSSSDSDGSRGSGSSSDSDAEGSSSGSDSGSDEESSDADESGDKLAAGSARDDDGAASDAEAAAAEEEEGYESADDEPAVDESAVDSWDNDDKQR
jgi:ribosomal protein S10